MKKIVVASILFAASGVASATSIYGGVSYSMLDSELTAGGASFKSEPTALNLIGGTHISENFAIEGVLGLGLSDDNIGIYDAKFEIKHSIGVYAVGIAPVSDTFNVYGKIGFANLEFEDADSDKASGSGVAYGVGAKVRFNESVSGALEYNVYPDTDYDDFEIDVETNTLDLRLNFIF